jgi:hypothetical protein
MKSMPDFYDSGSRKAEYEQMALDYMKQSKQIKEEQKQKQLLEQSKVKLFEGTLDSSGNYIPGKFELLTMPDYFKYVDMPADKRPRNWE